MCPAVSQCQRRAAHTLWCGQSIVAGVTIDLQDALEARQDVHRMAAMASGCIGEDDSGRIAATPPTIIARHRPEVAGFGLARLGVEHRCPGLVHEQATRSFEVD